MIPIILPHTHTHTTTQQRMKKRAQTPTPPPVGGTAIELSTTTTSNISAASGDAPGPAHSPALAGQPSDIHTYIEPGLAEGLMEEKRRRNAVREPWLYRPRVPASSWVPKYQRKDLFWDLQAGLVVGILLIPQSMAYATLANLSPIYGLYCALFPNVVYAIFGPSRESAVGAMALLSIMVGDIVTDHTAPHATLDERVNVAVKLAFLTGLFQIALGICKMGEVAIYVSHPVMQGFCSGGEILIAVSQLKFLTGIKIPAKKYAYQTLEYLFTHLKEIKPWTLLLGSVTFALLFSLSRWRRQTKARFEKQRLDSLASGVPPPPVPRLTRHLLLLANFGPFAAIVSTGFIAWGMDAQGVAPEVVGTVPHGLHVFPAFNISGAELHDLVGPAFLLAVIAFMLTFSVSKKYADLNNYTVEPNQELFALGMADFVGSFFGSFPVAGGFARTAVAVEANQKTQLSAVFAALIGTPVLPTHSFHSLFFTHVPTYLHSISPLAVLLAVCFLTKSFFWIPQCTLAAIVQVAICGVVDFKPFLYAYRASKNEFVVMFTTFLVTLAVGIDKGIVVGVALSIIVLLRHTSHPRLRVLGALPGRKRNVFRDVTRYTNAVQAPDVVIVRIDESVNFASCSSIKEQLVAIAQDPNVVLPKQRPRGLQGSSLFAGALSPNALIRRAFARDPSSSNGDGEEDGEREDGSRRVLVGGGGGRGGAAAPSSAFSSPARSGGAAHDDEDVEEARESTAPLLRPTNVVVDFCGVNHVDLSGLRMLDEVEAALRRGGQRMFIVNVKSSVRDKISNTSLWERVGGDLSFLALSALIDHLVGNENWAGEPDDTEEEEEEEEEEEDDRNLSGIVSRSVSRSGSSVRGTTSGGEPVAPMELVLDLSRNSSYADWVI